MAFFYLWLFALDWIGGLALALVVLPKVLVKSGNSLGRWSVRIVGVATWAVALHGAQLWGPLLASTLHADADFVAHDNRYCQGFDFVVPPADAPRFQFDGDETGQRWDPEIGRTIQGSSRFCFSECAAWMSSPRTRRVFVTDRLELPIFGGQIPTSGFLLMRPENVGGCTSAHPGRGPQETADAARPSGQCFPTTEAKPASPLLASTLDISSRNVGFGIIRFDYRWNFEEAVSHRILSSTHMIQLRHVSGTLEPFQTIQQITIGALTDPDAVVAGYFERNCGGTTP